MTVYVLTEGVTAGVFATLDAAKAAAESSDQPWGTVPSVKGSRPLWWRGARPSSVIEAFEVQS